MSLETAAAKLGARGVAIIVLIVLVLIVAGVAAWHWKDYQALKTYRANTETRAATVDEIDDGLAAATETVQTVRIQVEQTRSESDRRYQEVLRNDQNSRAWADTPIPNSVRNSDADPVD